MLFALDTKSESQAARAPRRVERGFTLFEALQVTAKRFNHQAMQRSLAVSLADAMVERVRINPTGIPTYNIGLANAVGGGSIGTEPSPKCQPEEEQDEEEQDEEEQAQAGDSCLASELASHDLWAWEQALEQGKT